MSSRRYLISGKAHVVEAPARPERSFRGEGLLRLSVDGVERVVEVLEVSAHHLDLIIDGRRVVLAHSPGEGEGSRWVSQGGRARLVTPAPERGRSGGGESSSQGGRVTPSFPATVVEVLVAPGDRVARGDPLVVVSAMKMEMTLSAPQGGLVRAVNCEVGGAVSPGDELVLVEPEGGEEADDER